MQIAIISDTHMPRGQRRIPPECAARLKGADLIIHAGDLVTVTVLRELEEMGPVVAVKGNVDDRELAALLPQTALVELDHSLSLAVVHDAGPARGRLARLGQKFPGAHAVIFGHSHLPWHERGPDGFQIFNPGSPTERRRAPRRTMGIAYTHRGGIEFELLGLG